VRTSSDTLRVGAIAPDFTLSDQHDRPVSLQDCLAEGRALLSFHRGTW